MCEIFKSINQSINLLSGFHVFWAGLGLAESDFELLIFLCHLQGVEIRAVYLPRQVSMVLGIEPRVLCMLGKCSTNWTISSA